VPGSAGASVNVKRLPGIKFNAGVQRKWEQLLVSHGAKGTVERMHAGSCALVNAPPYCVTLAALLCYCCVTLTEYKIIK
jgi:hypothetical protein